MTPLVTGRYMFSPDLKNSFVKESSLDEVEFVTMTQIESVLLKNGLKVESEKDWS